MMNREALLRLKREFGRYSSWALWAEDGGIIPLIERRDFESMIKPNIVFLGLNASNPLPEDWINFHSECSKYFRPSWKATHARKLTEVLMENQFESLKGAYMTDIIKGHYDSDSGVLVGKMRLDKNIVSDNIKLFEKELELLAEISGSNNFQIICIGKRCSDIVLKYLPKHNAYNIWHYSAYQLGREGVKEKIRQDLRKIVQKSL